MGDRTEAASGGRWRRVPAVAWLPRYERGWLRGDVVAGAVVAALAIPQSLGYASIAGAPVEVGLYAVPVALVAYAIFGSSRQLIVGPVSTVSVLSGSLLASFGVAGTAQAASYTAALALGAGLVLVIAGFLGIGWVAEFLSKPIVTGFVLGLTILVILGELPHLLGVPTPKGQVVERVGALGGSLSRGEADRATVIVSAVALLVLFGGPRLARWVPWGLVVLIGGLVASAALDLQAAGRRGRRVGAARAADAGAAVGGRRRPPGVARRRRDPGAGGSRGGAERCPVVRRPRRLPHRRRPGAARLRRGQPRLRLVRGHRGGRQPVQDGSRRATPAVARRWRASPQPCCPWSSSSPSRRRSRGCPRPSSAPSWSTRSGS